MGVEGVQLGIRMVDVFHRSPVLERKLAAPFGNGTFDQRQLADQKHVFGTAYQEILNGGSGDGHEVARRTLLALVGENDATGYFSTQFRHYVRTELRCASPPFTIDDFWLQFRTDYLEYYGSLSRLASVATGMRVPMEDPLERDVVDPLNSALDMAKAHLSPFSTYSRERAHHVEGAIAALTIAMLANFHAHAVTPLQSHLRKAGEDAEERKYLVEGLAELPALVEERFELFGALHYLFGQEWKDAYAMKVTLPRVLPIINAAHPEHLLWFAYELVRRGEGEMAFDWIESQGLLTFSEGVGKIKRQLESGDESISWLLEELGEGASVSHTRDVPLSLLFISVPRRAERST